MTGLSRFERVQQRAYGIWERAGRPHGNDREHWLQAEAEIAGEERPSPARRSAGRPARASGSAAKPAPRARKAPKARGA